MNKKCFKIKLIYKNVSFAYSGYSSWLGGGLWRWSKADVGPNSVDPGLDRGGQGSGGQGLGSQGSGWHSNCGLRW